MDRQFILEEIRRTAAENNGEPLGRRRFERETGVSRSDWYGKHWARWGDAVREAGLKPLPFQAAIPAEDLLDRLIELIQELKRFPTEGDLRIKARQVADFPSHTAFRRLGLKAERVAQVAQRCEERGGLDDVRQICEATPVRHRPTESQPAEDPVFGAVYLIKSGSYYKIGRSNSPGRREYELSIQLPEEVTTVHTIRTDDPSGIEAYWHRRFADRRKGGEWFDLNPADVKAFKRRKFM